jgi:hypothetical protein
MVLIPEMIFVSFAATDTPLKIALLAALPPT